MGGGKGGSKQTSSNPAWLDKAGSEMWDMAKSVYFNPAPVNPAAGGGAAAFNPAGKGGTTGVMGQPNPFGAGNARVSTATPQIGSNGLPMFGSFGNSGGAAQAAYSPGAGAGSGAPATGAMTYENMRGLPVYQGNDGTKGNPMFDDAFGLAKFASSGQKQPYLDTAKGYLGDAMADFDGSTNLMGSANARGRADLSSGRGYIGDATTAYTGMNRFGEEQLGQYMNPFAEAAINPAVRSLREERSRKSAEEAGMAVSKGAFGGSRAALESAYRDMATERNVSDTITTGMSTAWDKASNVFMQDEGRFQTQFNTERDRALKAAEQSRLFGATESEMGGREADVMQKAANGRISAADQQRQLGLARNTFDTTNFDLALRAATAQQGMDAQGYENWKEYRDYPRTAMAELAGLVNGSASRGTMQQGQQKPSMLSQLGGAALTGASIYSMVSEPHLKENIKKVGEQDGIGIYEFSYIGAPLYRYRGVMADEVAEKRPDAIVMDMDLRKVDHEKLGIPFERVR